MPGVHNLAFSCADADRRQIPSPKFVGSGGWPPSRNTPQGWAPAGAHPGEGTTAYQEFPVEQVGEPGQFGRFHQMKTIHRLFDRILAIEAPIHLELLTRRIILCYGLTRPGTRSVQIVRQLATQAASEGRCRLAGDFVWAAEAAPSRGRAPRSGRRGEGSVVAPAAVAPEEWQPGAGLAEACAPKASPGECSGGTPAIAPSCEGAPANVSGYPARVLPPPRGPNEAGEVRPPEQIPPEEWAAAAALVVRQAVGLPREELLKQAASLLGFKRLTTKLRPWADAGVVLLVNRGLVQDRQGQVSFVS